MKKFISRILAISVCAAFLVWPAFAAQDIGSMLPRDAASQGAIHLSGKGTANDPAIIYVAPKPLHGNYKTMKYHNEFCDHYNCKTCTKIFKNKAAAGKTVYSACGKCGG